MVKDTPLHPPEPAARPADEEEIAELLRSVAPVHRLPDHELPPIKAAARAAWLLQVRRTARRRRATYAGVAMAAALALAAGISVLRPTFLAPEPAAIAATLEAVVGEATIDGGRAREAAGHEVASGTEITTSDSGRTAFRLAAGHSVRVDVASSVRIVSGRALRLERGALYVDTEAARGHGGTPIEIETPFGRVTDIGTQFEVRLAAPDGADRSGSGPPADALRVIVREGTVRLATPSGDYEVTAGSELHLRAGGQLDRQPAPPYGASWQWMESVRPPLDIEGVSLTDFLDWASRESGRRWRFVEPGLRDRARDVVHGSIDGMTVEEALSTVLPSCGLRHRVAGEELLIESDQS